MKNHAWKVSEIAGFSVFSISGEELGKLVDVLPTGSNDVWVVRTSSFPVKELLIPALISIVREVIFEKKQIIVDLPPGLKEIYED